MTRLTGDQRRILQRMADGWVPLRIQVGTWRSLERRGLVRVDWGLEGTVSADKLCLYLTDQGREAIR